MKKSDTLLVSVGVDADMEWELIRKCRQGSTASFEPLVRDHQRRALSMAHALLGNGEEAADAVQEAFVKAYRALNRLREGSSFGPWFRSILRNQCFDRLRSVRPASDPWSEETIDRRIWNEPAALDSLEREELAGAVREALSMLSPEHRRILVLKEMEEMSYAGIAAEMQIPAGTVASRLHHARAAMKRALTTRGITGGDSR